MEGQFMELCLTVAAHEACHTVASLKLDAAKKIWEFFGENFAFRTTDPHLKCKVYFSHAARWFAVVPVGSVWVIDTANVESVWIYWDSEAVVEDAGIARADVEAAARAVATVEGQVESFEVGGVEFWAVRDRGLIQVSHLYHDEPDDEEDDADEAGFGPLSRERPEAELPLLARCGWHCRLQHPRRRGLDQRPGHGRPRHRAQLRRAHRGGRCCRGSVLSGLAWSAKRKLLAALLVICIVSGELFGLAQPAPRSCTQCAA
jgi:hypothetical protein